MPEGSRSRRRAATAAMGLLALPLCIAASLNPTSAAADEPFYRGKVVNLVVGFAVDNSFDSYGRLIARHLSKYLPGNPTIVVQNMPGAGSLRATNNLYNVAPKDGTTIGIIDQAMYLNQLMLLQGLQADVLKFNWIGRMVGNSAVLIARGAAAAKTADDLYTKELIVAASGSSSRLNWTALNTIAGTKLKLIIGYDGSGSARLAMERGEIDALSLPWFSVKLEYTEAMKQGQVHPILQAGIEKNAGLEHLPRMMDLAKDDEGRKVLEMFSGPSLIGRSLMAPPGLPPERVTELRNAFTQMLDDDAFKNEAGKMMLELDPMPGAKLQTMLSDLQYSPEVLEKARAIAKTTR
jgi:tripartite-type tricarboxylate transporter receptor subunit TctC